jgi:hypothetical protein
VPTTLPPHPPIDVLEAELEGCRVELEAIRVRLDWLSHTNGFVEREARTELRERYTRLVAHFERICMAVWSSRMATTQPECLTPHYREMHLWAEARAGSPRGSHRAWEALRLYRSHAHAILWLAREAWPDPDHLTPEERALLRARSQ